MRPTFRATAPSAEGGGEPFDSVAVIASFFSVLLFIYSKLS